MLLPAPSIYPQFPADTHYEELLLSLCRKVVELQETNSTIDVIDYSTKDEEKAVDIELNFKAKIIDGAVVAVTPNFAGFTFTPGTGTYPFGRPNLLDAILHLSIFLQKQEDKLIPSTGEKFLDWGIANGEGNWDEHDVTISLTGYQLIFDYSNYSSKAKPYL